MEPRDRSGHDDGPSLVPVAAGRPTGLAVVLVAGLATVIALGLASPRSPSPPEPRVRRATADALPTPAAAASPAAPADRESTPRRTLGDDGLMGCLAFPENPPCSTPSPRPRTPLLLEVVADFERQRPFTAVASADGSNGYTFRVPLRLSDDRITGDLALRVLADDGADVASADPIALRIDAAAARENGRRVVGAGRVATRAARPASRPAYPKAYEFVVDLVGRGDRRVLVVSVWSAARGSGRGPSGTIRRPRAPADMDDAVEPVDRLHEDH